MRHTRKSRSLVHLITRVSVIGIAITTAALVILIAAFNGIENMVVRLYSVYDAPITIRSTVGKTFIPTDKLTKQITSTPGVIRVSRVVEEIVVLKHEKKWVNAQMIGVDPNFLLTCDAKSHLVDGYPLLEKQRAPAGIIGATLMDKLDAYLLPNGEFEQLLVYTPLRDAKIGRRKSPFKTNRLSIAGRMNYNREVNAQQLLVPLSFAQQQLNYNGDLTAYYLAIQPEEDAMEIRDRLQETLGSKFIVKTAAEKNELIFKTSQSEKRIVIIILVFVFILAAFNLIASLTMLFIEKKENIETLQHMGTPFKSIFYIFFYEGLLIAGKGIIIGLVLGTAVCILQLYTGILEMPNSGGEAFPIAFSWQDGALIIGLVSGLSAITSSLPVYIMVRGITNSQGTR